MFQMHNHGGVARCCCRSRSDLGLSRHHDLLSIDRQYMDPPVFKTMAMRINPMRLLNLLRRVILGFRRRTLTAVHPPIQPEEPRFTDDLPPGYIPVETQISGQQVDGTSRWIGEDARVIQAPDEELITVERVRSLKCGCGHIVYSAEETVRETGISIGIGGICHYCSAEADNLVKRQTVTPSQAETMCLYCTRCARYCDGCGRQNLCSRHVSLFQDTSGHKQLLCPDCSRKAEQGKFFKSVIGAVAWLFTEDYDLPNREQEYHDN